MSDTIEYRGLTFRVELPQCSDMGAPWDEHDGHGPVRDVRYSDYSRIAKNPGERVLYAHRGDAWLYDWQGAMAKANSEGWGLAPDDVAALAMRIGREPTPGDIRAEAVQQDFDYCRRYLTDDWHWCGVVVTLLDTHSNPTELSESFWGIESDARQYLEATANELVRNLAEQVGRRKFLVRTPVRVRE